ncbi:MAG: Na+/H+ antiporter NhaC family protein, partial [Fusobacterium sp.]
IIMCIIYLLAGAFAGVSKAMGGVESTANLGLTFIPPQYITAGIFIITSFISTATGTSVGAIVAIAPIALELSTKANVPLAIILSAVMSGAMFGDDLSMISDTTIAATRTQGCLMKDKFKANISIAIPAAVLALILFLVFGRPETIVTAQYYDYSIIKILPYIFVLVLSLLGINVFIVLTGGIVFSGIVGIITDSFTWLQFTKEIYTGFINMNEIFILSLLTGGLATMVTKAGGVEWILHKIQKMITGKKSAQFGIGILVALTDFAVANNTVAIIINGPLAKKISEEHKLDNRRVAGILGIFSCIAQGIIPYGAQMLILIGFTKGALTPFDVIPLLWYQQILLVLTCISVFVPFYKSFLSDKKEKDEAFKNISLFEPEREIAE